MTHEKMPESLRLAEHLKNFRSFPDDIAAAAELERQHAEIERLRNALKVARMSSGYHMMHPETKALIDAALQAQPQETIAYVTRNEEGDPAMLFFDRNEARLYCEPGEEPEELVLAGPARRIEENEQ